MCISLHLWLCLRLSAARNWRLMPPAHCLFNATGAEVKIPNESWVIGGSVAEPTITNFHLTWSVCCCLLGVALCLGNVFEVSGSNPHLSDSVGCEWLLKLDPLKRSPRFGFACGLRPHAKPNLGLRLHGYSQLAGASTCMRQCATLDSACAGEILGATRTRLTQTGAGCFLRF